MNRFKITRISGLVFDLFGASLVAIAVLLEANKTYTGETLPEFEEDLDDTVNKETIITSIGLILIIIGFCLILASELLP